MFKRRCDPLSTIDTCEVVLVLCTPKTFLHGKFVIFPKFLIVENDI